MKKNNGLKKISVKVNGRDGQIYAALAEGISGSKKMVIEPGLTACLLPDGITLELYAEGAFYPDYLFAASDMVINYKVDDLDASVTALENAGAELLGQIEQVCVSYRYCHLKISAQHVLGIYEEKD